MDRPRRELRTSLAGSRYVLAPLAVGLLGCPLLLEDNFRIGLPTDAGSSGNAGSSGGPGSVSSLGGSGSAGNSGNAGTVGQASDSGATLLDAAGPPPPPPDSGPAVCIPAAESCDGRDNDCDDVVDEAPACASDCTGVLVGGRSGMFCGGAGATFANAESRCSAQSMRPVVVDSAGKSSEVLQAILPLYTTPLSEAQNSLWIDAHDGETEGTWHWGLSGPVFWLGDSTGSVQNGAYVGWASGKPNNSGTGVGEDCAVLHVDPNGPDAVGTWNDEACDGVHAFLCEGPVP